MPKAFASLAKRNVMFDFDTDGNCTLICTEGKLRFELTAIGTGTTMEDVLQVIAEHVKEFHPEKREH